MFSTERLASAKTVIRATLDMNHQHQVQKNLNTATQPSQKHKNTPKIQCLAFK